MNIKRIYFCTFFILFSLSSHASVLEDFDVVCQIFTEAKNTSFDDEKRGAYIEENIISRTSSKEVRDAYYSIFQLSPNERYAIFKESAEHATKKTWDCPAVKELLEWTSPTKTK